MKRPAVRPERLPILDGPASSSCGEDMTPPGRSPDLVCGRYSPSGRQAGNRSNEARDSSSDVQRCRFYCEQEKVPTKSQQTRELPPPTDRSEEPDGGSTARKIEQGVGDEKSPTCDEQD